MAEFLLRQSFRYEYATPARRLRHRLMVVPRALHGDQVLVDHDVSVHGAAAAVTAGADGFGNHVIEIRAARVPACIEFEVWARVRRDGPGGETSLVLTANGRRTLLARRPLTEADGFLTAVAGRLVATTGGGRAFAEAACSWTNSALTYEYGVTSVATTAAEAVAGGRGVCQDYAHVMLALCRAAGLPARYVSGHLVGEGGTHAWVEVVDPAAKMAVAFDPTHDRRAHDGYLTVAVGRDYADVAPTSGRFQGESPGLLRARKCLEVLDAAPAAAVLTR